jgi:hypothetical protein
VGTLLEMVAVEWAMCPVYLSGDICEKKESDSKPFIVLKPIISNIYIV